MIVWYNIDTLYLYAQAQKKNGTNRLCNTRIGNWRRYGGIVVLLIWKRIRINCLKIGQQELSRFGGRFTRFFTSYAI